MRRARTGSLTEASGLFLRRREGPHGLPAALLAEDEAQLLGRAQPLRVIRPERRARFVESEGTETVAGEEALLARHLLRPLVCARRRSNCRHPQGPLRLRLRHRTAAIKAQGRGWFKGCQDQASRKTQGFRAFPANTHEKALFLLLCGMSIPQPACFSGGMQILVTGVSGYVGAALAGR